MLLDLTKKCRSYRGFDSGYQVTREEMVRMVEVARYGASSMSGQALKFRLVNDPETVAAIQPLTGWAMGMPEVELPHPGKYPTAFTIVCLDKNISTNVAMYSRDAAIASQLILMAATEMGLGGCMLGTFQAGKLRTVLELPENLMPLLVIGMGKPDETIVMVDAVPGSNTTYYRDENDVHYVPKRTLEELIVD